MPDANITVYGAPWCPDCKRSKQFLGEQRVPYNWVDIDQDEEGRSYVQQANNGRQIIPTILLWLWEEGPPGCRRRFMPPAKASRRC